jgi:hypothetical protein
MRSKNKKKNRKQKGHSEKLTRDFTSIKAASYHPECKRVKSTGID